MDKRKKEKIFPISISLSFVVIFTLMLYFSATPLERLLSYLENAIYDLTVRYEHKPLDKNTPIVIVDVDDQSLAREGRWPWNRKKIGHLVSKLYNLGAEVVALDMVFSETEETFAEEMIQKLKKSQINNPSLLNELAQVKQNFDYDALFAQDLKNGNSVLGFAFKNEGEPVGTLPSPLFVLNKVQEKKLLVPIKASYLANIPILQASAKAAGFINADLSRDGAVRSTPMLLRYGSELFPSLSLAAAKLYLNQSEVKILTKKFQKQELMEGILLGDIRIPTDPWGRILVPFRGPPYTIPYVSATDVLNGNIPSKSFEHKLVFIGSSATAIGDIVPTAMAPAFAGVEIHAQTTSGIIDRYLPRKPSWAKGASIGLTVILGLILAFTLPFLGPLSATLSFFSLIFILVAFEYFIWKNNRIALSVISPIFSISVLYFFNEIYGYVFERRQNRQIKSIFSEYVPADYIDFMLMKKGDFGLEGETKEMTVLFADIQKFTAIAETLSASDLKKLLNAYLTPMTEAIFENKGTIDKYEGDMLIAFWGAPLKDAQHAEHAILAAFAMQKKLVILNENFRKENKAEIHIGTGINSGLMNVGDMGSKFRRAYTVLGDAVNLASRMEAVTRHYHVPIIVGEDTFKRTEALFVYRLLDRVLLKGKAIGVKIYEPIGLKSEVSNEQLEVLELHEKALEAYIHQKWDEAEHLFKEVQTKDVHKELYDVYLSRILAFKNIPPRPDWDGTYVFDVK